MMTSGFAAQCVFSIRLLPEDHTVEPERRRAVLSVLAQHRPVAPGCARPAGVKAPDRLLRPRGCTVVTAGQLSGCMRTRRVCVRWRSSRCGTTAITFGCAPHQQVSERQGAEVRRWRMCGQMGGCAKVLNASSLSSTLPS